MHDRADAGFVQCSLPAVHRQEDGCFVVAADEESEIKQSIDDVCSYCDPRRSSWHRYQGLGLSCHCINISISSGLISLPLDLN